jgi:hypothetical protein
MAQATLDWLRRLGEDHGFTVGSFMGADQAWLIRDGEPAFTFIIDDNNGGRGFTETLNLYWGSADYVSKPLYHFLVLTGGALNVEQGAMMGSLASQYRVRALLGLSVDELGRVIDEDVARLARVMRRYCDGTIPSLVRSVRTWAEKNPEFKKGLRCEAAYEPEDLTIFGEGGSLKPSRRTVPCSLEAGGVTLESVLPRLVDAGGCLRFSTEHRNLPFTLEFTLRGGSSSLTLRYEPGKGNLFQAYEFEEWLAAAIEYRNVKLVDSQSSRVLVEFSLRDLCCLG